MKRADARRYARRLLPVTAGTEARRVRREAAKAERRAIARAARMLAEKKRRPRRPWWRRIPWFLTRRGHRYHRMAKDLLG